MQEVHVVLEPEGTTLSLSRIKTVHQLLAALDLPEETALVIREGSLLTPDRRLLPGDRVCVRKVASRG